MMKGAAASGAIEARGATFFLWRFAIRLVHESEHPQADVSHVGYVSHRPALRRQLIEIIAHPVERVSLIEAPAHAFLHGFVGLRLVHAGHIIPAQKKGPLGGAGT